MVTRQGERPRLRRIYPHDWVGATEEPIQHEQWIFVPSGDGTAKGDS
jgi:hypothetical protein